MDPIESFDEDLFIQPRERKNVGIKNKKKDFKELPQYIDDEEEEVKVVRADGAWNDMIVDYTFYSDKNNSDLSVFLSKTKPYVEDKIRIGFRKHKAVTVNLVGMVQYNELDLFYNVIDLYV